MENKLESSSNEPIDPASSTGTPCHNNSINTPDFRVFSFPELKRATENFKWSALLGEGAFGPVYKGQIDPERPSQNENDPKFIGCYRKFKAKLRYQHHRKSAIHVAIKRWRTSSSFQGFKEWQNEVAFLGNLSHPNLIRLLGYCCEDENLLLVYEYMPNRSLDYHLYKNRHLYKGTEPLAWERRMSIALGAARGLAFLHAQETPIIYRNFKAADCLLDESFNAKISDFGVAKLGPSDGDSHVSTRVVSSNCVLAPEYLITGHLYVKSDVYNFGVVLLEMLTGWHANGFSYNSNKGCRSILEEPKPFLCDKIKLKTIMDERIKDGYPPEEAYKIAQLALSCLQRDPKSRPSMAEVVEILEHVRANNYE